MNNDKSLCISFYSGLGFTGNKGLELIGTRKESVII